MAEGGNPVPRRVRLWVVVAASVLLLASLMNLLLVVQGAPEVRPETQEGRTWQTSADAPQREGRVATWTFSVDPNGARIVELDVRLPWTVRVTHISGAAALAHTVTFLVDGETLETETDVVAESAPANESSRVSVTRSTSGDFSRVLRIERPADAPAFALVVTWDWALETEGDAESTFTTMVRPIAVVPVDTGGLPGCGSGCARVLFVVGLVAQTGAFVWYRKAPAAPRP